MEIKDLYQEIKDNNINIKLNNNGNLELEVSKGQLQNSDLIDKIKENKENLVKYLEERNKQKELFKDRITPFQEGLVSFVKNNPDSKRYIIQLTYQFEQQISFEKLYYACDLFVKKHEILRSTFDFDLNENIFKTQLLTSNYLDCVEINSHQEHEYRDQVFDISSKPLIRFALIDGNKLIIAFHHLVVDVNSIHITLKELFYIYSTVSNGAFLEETTNNIQFSSYIDWILNQDKNKAENYWKNLLQDYSPTLIENIRIKEQEEHGLEEFKEIKISSKINPKITDFLRSKRISNFTVLNFLGGFVLSKYYGGKEFVWGNSITHRYSNNLDLSGVIGPCIATIPISFNFFQDKNLISAIEDFHNQLLESRNYSYLSLNEIYNAINSDNLFSVLFSFQDISDFSELNDIEDNIQRLESENEVSSHFPLAILISQFDDNLDFNISYKTTLFEEEQINNMINLIINLFNDFDVLSNENLLKISLFEKYLFNQVAFLKGEEKELEGQNLLNYFNETVKKYPNRIALEDYEGNKVTYKELDLKSNYISKILIENKIKGQAVGINLNYNVNIVISVLGILKSGNYMVNLEQGFPEEKLAWLSSETNIKACVFRDFTQTIENLKEICLKIELPDEIPSIELKENIKIELNDICALYHTSGSTGTPKVIKITHQNTLNGLNWLLQNYPAQENEFFCLNIRLSFSPAIRNIFEPLSQGSKIMILPEFLYHNVDKFASFIFEKNITRIGLTPSFIKVLIENDKANFLKNIKILEIRGEATRMSDIKIIKTILKDTILLNRYGSTEASSTAYNSFYESDVLEFYPLGKPIINTTIQIVDDFLKPKLKNIVGEIFIKSKSLSLGYLNDDENKNVFVEVDNEIFLRTGDFGFIDSDDVLHYVGRKNRMIKVRGYRIEPSEIEYNLEQFQNVEKAVVIADENKTGTRLIAFCLVKEMTFFSEQNLKHFLKDRVPNYMIPNKIIPLESLPLTSTGKVDLMNLQEFLNDSAQKNLKEPRTITEKRIIGIFKKLMPDSVISINEDFYSMGIDSIVLMRTTYEIDLEFKIKIRAAEIFEYDTIEKLSEYIDKINLDENNRQIENYYKLNYHQDNKNILFLIPPLTGNSNYATLKPFIPKELDFVVFDTIPVEEYHTLGKDMETLAKFYKNIILKLSEGKAIHLAGWSFGASISFEIAVQLESIGNKVPTLILLDPTFYNEDFDSKNNEREDYLKILIALLEEEGIDPEEFDTSRIIEQMYHANQVSKRYKLKKYDGDIVLIKPESVSEFERNYQQEYNGLEDYCTGKINVSRVQGNHMTMTIGPAEFFAETLFGKIDMK